jgi:dihydropteroate synthase
MKHWTSPHRRPLPRPGARTLLMGIVNLTPDSFSDGGLHNSPDAAVAHARQLVADGADILDLGAESTRPGHAPVNAREELARLLPALRAIRDALPGVPISVDTYKADVAEEAVHAGADILNDIWGGQHGAVAGAVAGAVSPLCAVAARTGAPLILMHNRTAPVADAVFWPTFLNDLRHSLDAATAAGVAVSQLWLDPGFGFGKTPAQNLECLRHLDRVKALGFPVLLATSRKSTLGLVLGGAPPLERVEADKVAAVWGIATGADMLRLHDPGAFRKTLLVADAVKAGLAWPGSGGGVAQKLSGGGGSAGG